MCANHLRAKRWAAAAGLWLGLAAWAGAVEPPNVLVIVADDLGYADLAVQGGLDIPTPNVDSIAKQGIRFTSGYVSGPYCSPTRAGLMTGRYQERFGHEFNFGTPAEGPSRGLSLEETTLADRFKAAGYVTGMVGKWHLGDSEAMHPLSRGFTEYFGFLGGAHSYFKEERPDAPLRCVMRNRTPAPEKEYLTDAFAREAVAFIDRHARERFFLYLAFNAPHTPMEAPERYLQRFGQITKPLRRTYAAMLSAMDDAVGRVLDKLRSAGLEENTLIFFISDNGGPPINGSSNGPLHGYKATTWEGGVRVPYFIQWKARLPGGRVLDQPVIQLDIMPTALAAIGVETKPEWKLDGQNLLPWLLGQKTAAPHDALYWRFGRQMAIRMGDWKLVKAISKLPDEPPDSPPAPPMGKTPRLFNLDRDLGETNDLTSSEPQRVSDMQARWDQWNAGLVPPAWGEYEGGENVGKNRKKN